MGLDATVMCNCFRDGRATEPPVPREWLHVDEEGCLSVRPEHDSDDRWAVVHRWEQTCCPHPGMDYASEHIANWAGYRLFQAALAAVGWERFPVLRAELPRANGGTTPPTAAALALVELDAFRAAGCVGTSTVLVDPATGGVVAEHVAAYDGVFILDGRTGIDVGVGAAEFFVRDRATGADLFRAARFRQVVTQPAPGEGDPPAEVEFLNPQTGDRLRCRTAVPGRAAPTGRPPLVVPDPGSHPPPTTPPTDAPPPRTPTPAAGQPETVDAILKRLAAVRAERDALAKEEAALKDRLRERLREQAELIRSLGLAPGAAPATPAAGTPPLYFPTAVGAERVYLIGEREVRDVVTAVRRDGDAYLVTLAKPDQPGGEVRVLSVSPDRVLIHRNGELDYRPPHVVLRPGAKAGDSWHLFGVPGEGEVHRLAGAEEVTVPAGTFRALRVDYGKDTPAGFEAAGSLWYAPGVGSVKNTRGGTDVLLLKSFKPGDGTAPAGKK